MTSWLRPATLDELLDARAGGATLVGGGVGLCSAAFPGALTGALIDARAVLGGQVGGTHAGALATLATLAATPGVPAAIRRAAAATANPGVRRRITVGGVLGWRSPLADLPAALDVLDAQVRVAVQAGTAPTLVPLRALYGPEPPSVILDVHWAPATASSYRRAAGRPGPAPLTIGLAGVRRDGDIRLVASGAADTLLAFTPDRIPAEAELRNDARASARHRRRLLDRLLEQVIDDLEASP
ncbi:FAD binding domain-containing protein [Acrocarpospora sp. B8E8]|uniref:FAD binding domain-containing protein n=1 Tax=Acrocarpospora sp. B8E8 TaxID=3153572 RepID=UPI00325EED23